ncbi:MULTISPECIES: GNAT family N-acetyltransferase [Sphingobacterium]|uniref:GNAT family N-acetyltransferase n=1 Tax=Sphingobacterium ginsenosidimutans TaxID=687845 RepID=A0ABP7ZWX6_9SPHI|nr:GNAT family N-acetyltransferase [Sphingobacterium sp. E70]ULT23444.1 GNAT family N-acetyltransferase [Sphingobacterium sp. E70]
MKIQTFDSDCNKDKFTCGEDLLDRYLKLQASQDIKKKLATCTVMVDEKNNVIGYYTLSSNSVDKDSMPEELSKKFPPSYSALPCVLLGRLAIDNSAKGKGYGEILLFDALFKCLTLSKDLGILCIIVDPLNDQAIEFYKKYGFIYLPTSGKMMISIKTIERLAK